jgi:hypothetical protein
MKLFNVYVRRKIEGEWDYSFPTELYATYRAKNIEEVKKIFPKNGKDVFWVIEEIVWETLPTSTPIPTFL